jgi:dihydrofolate reductase
VSRLIACNIMSLDGYYASAEGNPLVLPMDPAFDRYNLERLRAAGTLLLGANSYRMFMPFWPAQASNPEAGDVHREFGTIYGRIPVTVVSDSLSTEDVAQWQKQTTIVRRADAAARVKDLKATTDGDILMFASSLTWNALLADGLVDEVHLVVGATVLGAGTPTFKAPVEAFGSVDVHPLGGSTNVVLRYTV